MTKNTPGGGAGADTGAAAAAGAAEASAGAAETAATGTLANIGLAPSNLAPPSISGGAVSGTVLSASTGTWSNAASYAYQWQRCEAGGAGCANVSGASAGSYALGAADVGHTIKVVVTASNLVGSLSVSSPDTAVVSGPKGCVAMPSSCGYPDVTNSGVPPGAGLSAAAEEEMHINSAGMTVKGVSVNGTIYVEADNDTIEDSEVVVEGSQSGCSESCGGKGIWIAPGVTGTRIKDVTCRGGAASGPNVTQYCIQSNDASTRVEAARMYDCTECYTGPGEVVDSFLEDNGTIPGEHYEDIYYGGGEGALVAVHDTLLNPHNQTAAVFASVDFGNQETLRIEEDLLAGGDYVIYGGGSGSGGKVLGPVTIKDNRFSKVFFANGGSYGVDCYVNAAVTEWTGNYWDETLAEVKEETCS